MLLSFSKFKVLHEPSIEPTHTVLNYESLIWYLQSDWIKRRLCHWSEHGSEEMCSFISWMLKNHAASDIAG